MVAKGGDIGIRAFILAGPRGNVIYNFSAPRGRDSLGGREILIESPEPLDLNLVLDAYPEGTYRFFAITAERERLCAEAELVHNIPAPTTITFPPEDGVISRFSLLVTWDPAEDVTGYVLELTNEETDDELIVNIPADTNSFQVPEEWIAAGVEYSVGVFVINQDGNKTASELSFNTAPE